MNIAASSSISVWKMVRYVIFALNALCLPSMTPPDPCLHACEDERMEHRSTNRVGIKYALIQRWELTIMFSTDCNLGSLQVNTDFQFCVQLAAVYTCLH